MTSSLTTSKKYLLIFLSFFIVAFGQPVWSVWLGLVSSVIGFACFWRVLLEIPSSKKRFFMAMGWYAAVQIVQLSWFASHPYAYIYAVLLFCAFLMGTQFGLIALAIRPDAFTKISHLCAITALWTVLEWSRLFILSGLSFNPVGLALSGAVYPLQLASIGGIYLLSFWVMLTNLLVLRAWLKSQAFISAAIVAAIPYLFGALHYHYHDRQMKKGEGRSLAVVLIQPALPIEENMGFQSAEEARNFVLHEWSRILATTQKHLGKQVDLMVLPEYVVPYGTYHPVFPLQEVEGLFLGLFGPESLEASPPLASPYAFLTQTDRGKQWLVSNAFIVQSLANLFQTHVVVGLEDSVYVDEEQTRHESYSAAFHFPPGNREAERYEKRVLVPMGEYIPFEFCRQMAARYGITGSFTCGKEAKIFKGPVPFGPTICYEETYGDLMRENRQKEAELLVNLTNDGWYPHSLLPQQHFDHARLRTVENGIPLVRSCNTGITGGIDSLGRLLGSLGLDSMQAQTVSDSLYLEVPTYHYHTLYTKWGDAFILSFCGLLMIWGLFDRKRK